MNNRSKIQKEIVDSLSNPVHGIVLVSPRVGKTKIAIDIVKKENPKSILWVTSSVKLRDTDIPNEFIGWKAKKYLKCTNIVCWDSLDKIQGFYDKIILDEYQFLTPNNCRYLLSGGLRSNSILCLSGTHPKHEDKLEVLSKLKLEILVEKTIDSAVEDKLIADYNIYVVEVPMNNKDKNVQAGSKTKPFMTTEENNYQYISKTINTMRYGGKDPKFLIIRRMQQIYNSPTKEAVAKYLIENLKGRKLVFAGSIEQSKRLSPYVFNSKTDKSDLDKFTNGDVDILSCVKSGGVGFTYRNVDHFIIIQADSNKRGDTTQKISRALLLQNNYKASIWIICLTGTQDEKWVESALSTFNKSKIEYIRYVNLVNKSIE